MYFLSFFDTETFFICHQFVWIYRIGRLNIITPQKITQQKNHRGTNQYWHRIFWLLLLFNNCVCVCVCVCSFLANYRYLLKICQQKQRWLCYYKGITFHFNSFRFWVMLYVCVNMLIYWFFFAVSQKKWLLLNEIDAKIDEQWRSNKHRDAMQIMSSMGALLGMIYRLNDFSTVSCCGINSVFNWNEWQKAIGIQ